MANEEKLKELENVDVESLSLEQLEEVAGGLCSGTNCSNKQN